MMSTLYFCMISIVLIMIFKSRIQVEIKSKEQYEVFNNSNNYQDIAYDEFKRNSQKILLSDNVEISFNSYLTALNSRLEKKYKASKEALINSYFIFAYSTQELVDQRSKALHEIQILESLIDQLKSLQNQYEKGAVY